MLLAVLAAVGSELTSTDFDHPGSLTGGIQEALDALPEEGGSVYVPPGIHTLHRPLIIETYPPHMSRTQRQVVLRGAGRNSVIRKSPNFRVMLAEDVRREAGLDYVVVADSSRLRPGMFVVVMDARGLMGGGRLVGEVVSVEGARVHLKAHSKTAWWERGPWKPTRDFLVERGACLVHTFPLVSGGVRGAVIKDLAFDGNKEEQKIDGVEFWDGYPWAARRNARNLTYLSGGTVVERCFVYDAGHVNISFSGRATVVRSEIWGAREGIHPGAGPDARITGNIIRDNLESGIFMCMGNHGIVISENHIFRNGVGIQGLGTRTLGTADEPLLRDGDHYCIIANNVIYDNMGAGIGGQQGDEGAEDFVITGNVIYNNHLGRPPGMRAVQPANLPAGISLYNAKRCVVVGNRVFDDQHRYGTELHEDAPPGATRLRVRNIQSIPICDSVPFQHPRYVMIHAAEGTSEILTVVSGSGRTFAHVDLNLAEPLDRGFPAGARVHPVQTQAWGIAIVGPHARDNLVAHNICLDNRDGGILWQGQGSLVEGNLGLVVGADDSAPLADQFQAER